MDAIKGAADAQPSWLHPWFNFWTNLQSPHPYFWAYLVAVLESVIAIALILGFARKTTYISAIAFSMLIWATAEGFGGPYTSGAADIGTAIIYALVFAGLLGLSAYADPARYSVDHWIEQRVSWWRRVAELRRPPVEVPTVTSAPGVAHQQLRSA